MVTISIQEKIVDEQLMSGKKVIVQYHTTFNGILIEKIFPDDFTPEQQFLFKQIYEQVVYGSEIGNKIFKCKNENHVIKISGYMRVGDTVEAVEDFDVSQPIKLKFTRYGLENKSVEIENFFGVDFLPEEVAELQSIGIKVIGNSKEFEITSFDADISVEVIKEDSDSFIDLGEFKNGKLIIKK